MIKPTRGYVLIEAEETEEKTASGLYVPDNAKEKPQKGIVLEVGEPLVVDMTAPQGGLSAYAKAWRPCKEGDKVYYNRWAGSDITEGRKEYKIVKFEDVLAVIE